MITTRAEVSGTRPGPVLLEGTCAQRAAGYLSRGNLKRALDAAMEGLGQDPDDAQCRSVYERLVYGLAYPTRMIIEPTNYCVMGCPGCTSRGGKVGFMPLDRFAKLAAEVGPNLTNLVLHQRGDSFYHPDIYDMIDMLGEYPSLNVMISTHGSFDLDIDRLAGTNAKLEIVFSVDGLTRETLTAYRRNADIDLIFRNMREIVAARKALGKQWPMVHWKFIVMKTNEQEKNLVQAKADELDCDKLSFAQFAVSWLVLKNKKNIEKYLDKFVPSDKHYFANDIHDVLHGKVNYKGNDLQHCFNIGISKPCVRWNGDVIPCCMQVPPHTRIMGNIFEAASFREIWDDSVYRAFRKQAVLDCRVMKPCDQCHIIS
jgi:radical SAM protein with 4Fe4S-binding SPASM domain